MKEGIELIVEVDDELRSWLDSWINHGAEPTDVLTWMWFTGEAKPGSGFTREKALSDWIAASESEWLAWESVRCLLRILREKNQPIPVALHLWALDVADGTRRPPSRKRGRDATQNVFRNRSIVMAVMMLTTHRIPATSNIPGRSACHLVAECAHLSYEAVRTIWQSNKDMTPADYLSLDEFVPLETVH